MEYVPPINGNLADPNRSYINANPGASVEGSIPAAESIEHPIREIVNAITAAGLTPDGGDLTQLADAIEILAGGGALPKTIFRRLAGLTLSNNVADATNDIDIAEGLALSDDLSTIITLNSALTKRLDATFTAGNGGGGLDTGTKAANTTYHVFLIYNPTTLAVDVIFSTSLSSPVMPSGFTKKRYLMSLITTAASAWRTFKQRGDEVRYQSQAVDINTSITNTPNLNTLPVPVGKKIEAIFTIEAARTNANAYIHAYDPDDTITLPPVYNIGVTGGGGYSGLLSIEKYVMTNTAAQISTYASTSSTGLRISTMGYKIDRELP